MLRNSNGWRRHAISDAARLNEMMRDRLVCGVANEKWQQRLLAEDNFTYDKAFKLLLSMEVSEKEKRQRYASRLFLGNVCMLITLGIFSAICFSLLWILQMAESG